MINWIKDRRFLILRRVSQATFVTLLMAGHHLGWNILKGNYSAASVFNTIPLTDPLALLQILFSGFMVGTKALLGGLIVILLYGLVVGRAFCSWVCPINPINNLAEYLGKKLSMDNPLLKMLSRNARYWILALALLLSAITHISAFEAISPIGLFFRAIVYGIGSSWAFLLAFFMFEMVLAKNGWCGYLCPLGAFYSLIGRFRILKIKHNVENCTKCNLCFPVCPEVQVLKIVKIESGRIKSGECTNCGKCVDACKDNALKFSIK